MQKKYRELLENKEALIILEKAFGITPGKKLEVFKNHKKIKSSTLVFYNDVWNMVITTVNLKYSYDNLVNGESIGGYKILIPKNAVYSHNIKIMNYTKCLPRAQHICVKSTFDVCWGAVMESFVRNSLRHKKYFQLIYQIINFLEEPGATSEYTHYSKIINENKARKIRPRNEMDWFNRTYLKRDYEK